MPALLSYIQVIVDETPKKGQFILTGAINWSFIKQVTQSLAGRTAILNLLPLSLAELTEAKIDILLDEILLRGGYPRIYADNLDPSKAYRNYFQTYIEQDLRQ